MTAETNRKMSCARKLLLIVVALLVVLVLVGVVAFLLATRSPGERQSQYLTMADGTQDRRRRVAAGRPGAGPESANHAARSALLAKLSARPYGPDLSGAGYGYGSYYRSFERADAAPLVPGEVAKLKFNLYPTSVLIKEGHRLRVAVAGHDASVFDRYPAQGTPLLSVQRNSVYSSYIELPVMARE